MDENALRALLGSKCQDHDPLADLVAVLACRWTYLWLSTSPSDSPSAPASRTSPGPPREGPCFRVPAATGSLDFVGHEHDSCKSGRSTSWVACLRDAKARCHR